MAKSIKSVLKGIKFVDVAVVVVFVAVMICLMKKMDVIEGLCVPSQRGIDLFNRINDEVGAQPGIDIPTECREAEARRGACEYLMLPQYYTDPTGNQRIPPFNMCEEAPSLPPSMTQCQEARDTLRDCP